MPADCNDSINSFLDTRDKYFVGLNKMYIYASDDTYKIATSIANKIPYSVMSEREDVNIVSQIIETNSKYDPDSISQDITSLMRSACQELPVEKLSRCI